MSILQREADATTDPKGRVPEQRFQSRLLPVLAFLALAAFLGVLVLWVPRLDLGTVVVLTLGLAAWDFFADR